MTAVSGGSGAPLRNESGKLLVPLREDPSITFGESTRNYVDKDLRYRTTPAEQNAYRLELDQIVEEKKRLKYNEKFGNSAYKNVILIALQSIAKLNFQSFPRTTRSLGVGQDRAELHGATQRTSDTTS